jgi:hypothetical protein
MTVTIVPMETYADAYEMQVLVDEKSDKNLKDVFRHNHYWTPVYA